MKKTILVYGIIAGTIIIASMILSLAVNTVGESESFSKFAMELLGYLIMIIAFSAIFIGVKRYRDQDQGGVINFPQALKVGLGITAVASVVYVVAWEINLAVTDYAFISEYAASIIKAKQESGLSDAEMAEVISEMDGLKEQYANPMFRVPMTFLEILPVGLVISLASAAALRKSDVLPATD